MDNKELKQTITKGQAVEIADAEIFNSQVKPVRLDGSDNRHISQGYKPKKEVLDRTELDLTISCDSIYNADYTNLFIDGDRYGDGIRVVGYAKESGKTHRDDKSNGFTIYLDNEEQIIQFAQQCLDVLAIKKEKGYLFKQYEDKHPELLNHFPNLKERTMCETGLYYWDGSLNKVVEITEETDGDLLADHPSYDTDGHGNFEPDYWNEKAMKKLQGIIEGENCGWTGDTYMDINIGELQVGGTYRNGYHARKVRTEEDKRKKKWITTFIYKDGTQTNLDGKWEVTDYGTLHRDTWGEN